MSPNALSLRVMPSIDRRFVVALTAATLVLVMADGLVHAAMAQSPFGAGRGAVPDSQVGGVVGWVLEMQSQFYRQMSGTIRAAKDDGSAIWTLLAISFAYGIFHAAGPGHGKAVISSYLVANEETARRGIVLSFASALLQALVAIVVVGICAWLLNATMKTMCGAERAIEIASYALIAAFGARLLFVKGRGFIHALQGARFPFGTVASPTLAPALTPVAEPVHETVTQGAAAPGSVMRLNHVHPQRSFAAAAAPRAAQIRSAQSPVHGQPGHVHDEHCGHNHGPTPDRLAGPGGWRRGLGAIVAVGLRPCSGAILVLVFALAQGMFWAGIAATLLMGLGTAITVATIAIIAVTAKGFARRLSVGHEGSGAVILRGVECGAAALVLAFGTLLLFGYVAAERVTCF